MIRIHRLKTWKVPFEDVWNKTKTYEVRVDDRNFQVGDVFDLREWIPFREIYTSRGVLAVIAHKTEGGQWELPKSTCVLGLANTINYFNTDARGCTTPHEAES